MIKIMLADDNKLALEYFSKLIDWNKYGYEIVCKAIDGETALIQFKKYCPEVIITDVKMPNMTGIELAEQVLRIAPDTIIVFLSSYEEFDYVKSALNLGVFDYILKHETKAEQLIEKLLAIKELLGNKEKDKYYIAEGDFTYLLNKYRSVNSISESDYSKRFPLKYNLLMIEQDHVFPVISKYTGIETDEINENEFKEACYLNDKVVAVLKTKKYRYLILTEFGLNSIEFAYYIKENLKIKFSASFSVILVADNDMINICLEKYNKQKTYINQKYFFPKSTVLYQELLQHGSTRSNIDANKIKELFDSENISAISKIMDQNYLDAISTKDYGAFESITDVFVFLILSKHLVLVDSRTKKPFEVFNSTTIEMWYDANSIFQWIKERYSVMAQILSLSNYKHYSKLVTDVIIYINNNFSNCDLSAEQIASAFEININKLNAVFKRETGGTVWKLITKSRMEEAVKLLDDNQYKISLISERVGYKTISYFSNVFRKYYGISPQEHRRKNEKKATLF